MAVELKDLDPMSFPLFDGLDPKIVQDFIGIGKLAKFQTDSPIVLNEDAGHTFFIILKGLAKVTLYRGTENQISLMILKSGDFFGEVAILENHHSRTANVLAMTDVEVLGIEQNGFLEMMRKHPDLPLNLARVLGRRIRLMNERMVALTLPPYIKVARTLMLIACKPPLDYTDPIPLPELSMQEWLQFCHSNKAELVGCLAIMEKAGALKWVDGQITILNVVTLKEFAVGNLP